MESPKIKRRKLPKNNCVETSADSLITICDWSQSESVAVKHHEDAQTSTKITYAELSAAKLAVNRILRDTRTSLFIGITFDVPLYCLPGLMLGIMSADHAFICLPSSTLEAEKLCDKLQISHIFSSQNSSELEVTSEFEIHRKRLFLLQAKDVCLNIIGSASKEEIFAYAVATSGSTGEPKMVKVPHRSILPNIVDLRKILDAKNSDTIAQITPTTFDPSIIEIFLSLSCGGSLFTVSQELKNDPKTLLKLIVDSRVSVLQSTPSLLLHRWSSQVLRQTILGENSNLRILLLGGENFPTCEVLRRIKAPGNRTRIFDIYGITEVSCWASIREILQHDSTRILGKALSETILQVRKEDGSIVEEGEGVLHIGSDSRICVIDDEVIAPSDFPVFRNTGDVVMCDRKGSITLRGRIGRRVKRFGTKLDLTELEVHVLQLPFVENCYALFTENNQSLHLFFTTAKKNSEKNEKFICEMDVLRHTTKLSNIYRPDKVYLLDKFELTSNGKICRKFLKKLSSRFSMNSRATKSDGETKANEILANIWKRFLPFAEDSGFLDLGGNSVMALRIAAELAEEIGHDSPELVGRLLRNENLNTCREYVSKRGLNSAIRTAEDKPKELLIHRSYALNVDDKLSREDETPAVHMANNLVETEITAAWQKCRGRNSFPEEIEAGNLNTWFNVAEIRIQTLYDLRKCVDASPTVFAYPGGRSYVTVGSHSGVICTAELSKEKCPEKWEIALPDRIEASILILNDFKAVVGSYDGCVYCFHLKTGEIFWKFRTGDAVKCTAVLCSRKRNIFFGSYDHQAYCVSLENGSEVWKVKAGCGSISATPCLHSQLDSVLFAMLDGTCVSLKQNSGCILWRNKLDYPIFSAPIILENGEAVFCDVSGKLTGFSAATGTKVWSVEINGTVFSHLLVNADPTTRLQSILFASKNQSIYRFDCSFGEKAPILQLKESLGVPMFSTPWTNGKVIVVVGTNGELKLLDFVTGNLLNSFKFGGDVFSSPIIHEDFIVVGCRDNNLYILTTR